MFVKNWIRVFMSCKGLMARILYNWNPFAHRNLQFSGQIRHFSTELFLFAKSRSIIVKNE